MTLTAGPTGVIPIPRPPGRPSTSRIVIAPEPAPPVNRTADTKPSGDTSWSAGSSPKSTAVRTTFRGGGLGTGSTIGGRSVIGPSGVSGVMTRSLPSCGIRSRMVSVCTSRSPISPFTPARGSMGIRSYSSKTTRTSRPSAAALVTDVDASWTRTPSWGALPSMTERLIVSYASSGGSSVVNPGRSASTVTYARPPIGTSSAASVYVIPESAKFS